MTRSFLLLFGMFSLLKPDPIKAQEGCMEELTSTFAALKRSVEEAPRKALHSSMVVTTTYSGEGGKASRDTIDQYSDGQRSIIEDQYMSQYEDADHRVL